MAGLRVVLSVKGGAKRAWAQSLVWLALPKNPLHGGHLNLAAALAAAGPGLALERLDVWSTGMSKAGALAWVGALVRVDVVAAPRLVAMDVENQYPRLDVEAEAALRGALRARRRAQRKGEGGVG
jgi:hypothetical protein